MIRRAWLGVRTTGRLLRALVHLLHGIAVIALRFPALDEAGRHARIGRWSAQLLRLMGLTLHASGRPHPGAALLVANHVSWLDIAALHAVAPHARFVAKSDVRRWPLVGRLVSGAGTLYIERASKRDAVRLVHTIAAALQSGQTVAVFPEGTTSDGRDVLPFHANLLQAAVAAGVPVQPAALRFAEPGMRCSPAAEFLGSTTLLQSIWRVARAERLAVHVDLLPALPTSGVARRELAAQLRGRIADCIAGEDVAAATAPAGGVSGAPAVAAAARRAA